MDHVINKIDSNEDKQYLEMPPMLEVNIKEEFQHIKTEEVKQELKETEENLLEFDSCHLNVLHSMFAENVNEEAVTDQGTYTAELNIKCEDSAGLTSNISESERTFVSDMQQTGLLVFDDKQYILPDKGPKYSCRKHRVRKKINFQCDVCHKTFNRKTDIRRHISAVHEKNKFHKCTDCTKKYSRKEHLKTHYDIVHKGAEKFQCYECYKKFTRITNLDIHVNSVHKKVNQFECKVCHKVFYRMSNLIAHNSSVHQKLKCYECQECHKVFYRNSNFQTHIRVVHLKLKPFKCGDCSKLFPSESHLRRHIIRVHIKQKLSI